MEGQDVSIEMVKTAEKQQPETALTGLAREEAKVKYKFVFELEKQGYSELINLYSEVRREMDCIRTHRPFSSSIELHCVADDGSLCVIQLYKLL